ncbi:MAG: RluA family pseudouridine synthase [Tenericutes bacterium]|nr:RluA family pseudouridine synthase [Mycoplasmatota bacterium]
MEGGNQVNNINIIYEDNHLLVVEKPINIPVQEDSSEDKDFLNILKRYIKEKYDKKGNVYLGLVHRLDRPVGGIMVFAKTSKSASRLSEQIRSRKLEKKYYAVVCGNINNSGTLKDKLLKDTKLNVVKIDEKGKEAILHYKKISDINNLSLIEVELETGRSHQIRVQLSNYGFPLYGDQKYNKKAVVGQQIALYAKELCFYHPTTNKLLTFSLDLPKRTPFNLFGKGKI